MKELNLLVSLGHNSSAIGILNDEVIGYEEERLNREKSSSKFPSLSIDKLLSDFDLIEGDSINFHVGHWFDHFDFHEKEHLKESSNFRHYDFDYVSSLRKKYSLSLFTLSEEFTHHDSHAYSALCFLKSNKEDVKLDDYHVLIVDGYGNREEVVSLYNVEDEIPINIMKVKGYEHSLGSLYQFATSFCGMKENEDEYKFLGYESHIQKYLTPEGIELLIERAYDDCRKFYPVELTDNSSDPVVDSEINFKKFSETRNLIHDRLLDVLNFIYNSTKKHNVDEFAKRCIIGFYIQNVLETYCKFILEKYSIKNICVSGGVFYNVKLNNTILNNVDSLCVMPLAGDQGSTLGMYYRQNDKFRLNDLFLGKRNLMRSKESDSALYFENDENLIDFLEEAIMNGEIVNVISGPMEYGPRALCNTTTLALPRSDLVATINEINGRNTVMPMAPIMLEENLDFFFDKKQFEKVVGSLKYMIVTLDYKENMKHPNALRDYRGVMHNYPLNPDEYSGRPQVITGEMNDHYVRKLLARLDERHQVKALINTSFNVHGRPICYSLDDAIGDYEEQMRFVKEKQIETPVSLVCVT